MSYYALALALTPYPRAPTCLTSPLLLACVGVCMRAYPPVAVVLIA